jgi:cytoskeletal protein CcmA (bactofilin family)
VSLLAPVMLTAATTALAALPLTPAIREFLRREDAAPLPTRTDDGEIRSFAQSFHRYLEPLLPQLDEAARAGDTRVITTPDGNPGLLLGSRGACDLAGRTVDQVVLCAQDAFLPPRVSFTRDLYVRGRLVGGVDNVIRAALVEGDASLGDRTTLLRWLHVHGNLTAGGSCQLFGRVSADGNICLGYDCRFERVSAPAILAALEEIPPYLQRLQSTGDRSTIDRRFGRLRVNGEVHLATGDVVQGHIVALGSVRVDEGARVTGSIKSHAQVRLGASVEVHGAITGFSQLSIAERCFVRGPLLCEGEVLIGTGAQIGSPDCPTTVSAPRIRIAPGAVVYGTLWAREAGEVLS